MSVSIYVYLCISIRIHAVYIDICLYRSIYTRCLAPFLEGKGGSEVAIINYHWKLNEQIGYPMANVVIMYVNSLNRTGYWWIGLYLSCVSRAGLLGNNEVSLKDATFWDQLKSQEFCRVTLFIVVASFWANFYIGTIDIQVGLSLDKMLIYFTNLIGKFQGSYSLTHLLRLCTQQHR